MLKTRLIRMGLRTIYRSGLAHAMGGIWGGKGVIFCLHHVTPPGEHQAFAPNSQLEITPHFLNSLLEWLVANNFELISIADVPSRLVQHNKRRFAVFTLDDGYKDNLVHALPVFKRHECPFTVYVAPRIAEGTCELWWRGLEAIIAKSDEVTLTIKGTELAANTATTTAKWAAWHRFAPRLQTMPEYEQRDCIRAGATAHGVNLEALCREAAMTWDEIRRLALEPLATIGAHTLNHYNLKKLPPPDAAREIVDSRKHVESQLQRPVQHFAYPYGNRDAAGTREFSLAKEAGYATAVVTRLGTLSAQHANHLHALPRVMLSGRYQDLKLVNALVSGVPGRLANRGRALDVA